MSTSTDTRRAPGRSAGTEGGKGTAGGTKTRSARGTSRTRPSTRSAAPAADARAKGGQGRAPRIPFVLLILCLLGGALVSLLVLRGVVAQEAYTITRLQSENQELAYEEQQRRNTVAHLESSERVAGEAEGMGMEQTEEPPLFLDLGNGEITGDSGSGE